MSSKGDTIILNWLGTIVAINWVYTLEKAYPLHRQPRKPPMKMLAASKSVRADQVGTGKPVWQLKPFTKKLKCSFPVLRDYHDFQKRHGYFELVRDNSSHQLGLYFGKGVSTPWAAHKTTNRNARCIWVSLSRSSGKTRVTTKTIYQKNVGHAKAVDTKNYKILNNKNTY